MRNLARAITTAGVTLAVGLVAVPSASALVKEAPKTVAAKSSATSAKKSSALSKTAAQALASSRPVTINVYYVMHDGRVISEQGPGNSAAHEVEGNSGAVDVQTQNEPISTGDLRAEVNGKQTDSPVTFEVEGSEQDTGEVS